MVYIYRKIIGKKPYYYLRVSTRKKNKIIIKDVAYLGKDLKDIKKKLASLPKYSGEIRKAYRTINKFIEINYYLQKIKALKLKISSFIDKNLLENVEACKMYWNKVFQKLDYKSEQEVLKNFVIEFAYNTTSIEGNTITLKETQKLLLEYLTPKNKTLREIFDLQNTEKVFFELLDKFDKKMNHELICNVHDSLLENVDPRRGYRISDIIVLKMKFKSTPGPYVFTDMKLLIKWYNENKNKLHPFVLATIFHHKFEKIHPFYDGNGRTGRMIMNFILMSKNYPPLIYLNRNRLEYLRKLGKADEANLTDFGVKFYKDLINFSIKQLMYSYWNIFL